MAVRQGTNAGPQGLIAAVISAEVSHEYHRMLITQVVRMLCAGIVHGDLSEYNVLVDSDGPSLSTCHRPPMRPPISGLQNAVRDHESWLINLVRRYVHVSWGEDRPVHLKPVVAPRREQVAVKRCFGDVLSRHPSYHPLSERSHRQTTAGLTAK